MTAFDRVALVVVAVVAATVSIATVYLIAYRSEGRQ